MQHDVPALEAPTPAARLWTAALAALLAGLVCACSAEPGPPSVLLVSVDTLRRDHCSVYGYERDTTPRLRAFAEQGVRFESAYAPMGLTGPSHATLFTSLYPLRHGLVTNGLVLREEFTTLAEYLAAHGYQTAGVASSFVLARKFGFGQGFAFYDDAFDSAEATTELYDLRNDPEERTNLAVAELQHSVRLRKQLEAWIEAQRSVAPEAGSVSESDRARLRALGYAD